MVRGAGCEVLSKEPLATFNICNQNHQTQLHQCVFYSLYFTHIEHRTDSFNSCHQMKYSTIGMGSVDVMGGGNDIGGINGMVGGNTFSEKLDFCSKQRF